MSSDVLTVLLAVLGGLVCGAFVPRLIGALPEPSDATDGADSGDGVDGADAEEPDKHAMAPAPPKELYADIAARPRLGLFTAVATAAVAGVLAGVVGASGALFFLMPLAPIGVALAVIDWRTTLLPTRIIAPTYGVVVLGVLLAWAVDGVRDDLVRAGWGWLALGGFYLLLWLIYPRGIGYGDVRLSGILGLALGYLGWQELVVGAYAAFLIGGVCGVVLGLLKIFHRKRVPFGPFMLAAAVIGVVWGDAIAGSLGY